MHRQLKAAGPVLALAAAFLGAWCPPSVRAELRFRALSDRTAYLAPLDQTPVGLPPAWRLRSTNPGFNMFGDPTVSITVNPMTGLVRESYREVDVELREPLVASDVEYANLLTSRTARRLWREKSRESRSIQRSQPGRGGLFRVELPVQLPKAVRSIVGDGAPNLEVSGSETITLAGVSDWTANRTSNTGERRPQGAFPSFEMKQELNVNLTGSIGDKIKVDVDQSSNVQTSLDNKVKLRYAGDEDDMIKLVELGNTNLSLQGASIRQEGLFGVKTVAKLGNWDMTTIASKQEGKNETARFTPSGDKTHVIIRDQEYIKRQYYVMTDAPAVLDYEKHGVYKRETIGVNTLIPGIARLDPTQPADSLNNPEIIVNWRQLQFGTEYVIEENYWTGLGGGLKIPVIRLTTPLSPTDILAVTYTDKTSGTGVRVGYGREFLDLVDDAVQKPAGKMLLKVIKQNENELNTDPNGDFDPADSWFLTIRHELRNFYDLTARNISTTTMNFTIRKIDSSLPTDPDNNLDGTPFIRILGLDQKDIANSNNPDGKVDPQYIDTERGIVFFPDITPFDPTGVPGVGCSPPYTGFLCLNDSVRNVLRREDGTANPLVYHRRVVNPSLDSRYYIDAEFQSSRQGYFLGRFNVLEGSDVVKVDNLPWNRGTDYTIDYDTGQLTFLKLPGPDQVITVDYSFAPGVGQVQRTLLGFSTTYSPSNSLSLSSSVLYESKGAQEQLVKLGEEPATSMIGDFSGLISLRPVWMTELTNRLPGIQTSQPSGLNLQGSFSSSLPNPNTKGEAFIDDMEGNKESNTVSLSRTQWLWSSVPEGLSPTLATHADLDWYNPPTVKEWYLKPTLKKEEGGDNTHQVLELNLKPPVGDSLLVRQDWTGVTLSLATAGQDLSKVQYFEIWMNDFRPDHDQTQGRLHLDFGRVSEDAFWDFKNLPNGKLDTEDKNRDGRLDRRETNDPLYTDPLNGHEDTGLDGLVDEQEGSGPDPNQDNYEYEAPSTDYSKINNLEENWLSDPNARPDTEDLNRDWTLDTVNNYFETTIDLADTHFVAIDVPKLYAANENVKSNNGWRLYRIPLSAFNAVNAASWSNVQAVRIWVDSMTVPLKLQVGGIEMIGNRWLREAFRDTTMEDRGVKLEVRSRNNKDDAGIYMAPYEVENAVGSSATRREQSLALAYEGLAEGDTAFAFKTYGDVGNALGWTLYRELRFYIHGDPGVESQNLRAVARFGPDTLNYYEYSIPLRSGWQPILIPLERLSVLKAQRGLARGSIDSLYLDRETGAATGEIYAVFGNPSFTRINRISFGLTADGPPLAPVLGEAWFDELRLTDVRKDKGYTSNFSLQANFSDLLSVNTSYNRQDQDYFRVGQGASQGSGFDHTAIGFSSTLNVDRFIPTSGVQLPVRVSLQHSSDVPKFRTGSDVILDESRSDLETRELNRQSIDLSYHRTSPKKGIARYTLDAISGSLSYSRQGSVNTQSSDSSWSFNSNVSYSIPIGGNGVRLGPLRVNPIPRTILLTSDWVSTRNLSYSRTLNDTTDVQTLRSDLKQRVLSLSMATSFEPLSGIRMKYNINSVRDMLLHQQDFFGMNKGTEIRHDQSVDLNYRPRWITFLQPEINLTGRYGENASPEVRVADTDPTNLKTIQNSGNARTNITIPLSRLAGRRGTAARDTSRSFSPLAPLRFALSKMQDISATFDFRRNAVVSRVVGDPGLAFKSGFTEVFAGEIDRFPNSVFQTSRGYNARANTAFQPIEKITFDIHGDYQLTFSDQVGGARRDLSVNWPNVNARWKDLQRLLNLEGPISSLTLSSLFQKKNSQTGPEGGTVEQRTETTSYAPLLGWEASFRSGVRANASTSIENARTTDERAFGYSRSRSTVNTTVQVNKTFPASKGIKFPWNKKRVRLPNDLNLGAQTAIGSDQTVLHQQAGAYVEQDLRTLNVTSSTNYNFSRSISGGFNLAFRQNKDQKNHLVTRGLTIAFTGSFRF